MAVTVDISDMRRLEEMAGRPDAFVATVAKVVLALLNDRFDAEYRAQMAEIASANLQATLDAIRSVVEAPSEDIEERVRQIAELL